MWNPMATTQLPDTAQRLICCRYCAILGTKKLHGKLLHSGDIPRGGISLPLAQLLLRKTGMDKMLRDLLTA